MLGFCCSRTLFDIHFNLIHLFFSEEFVIYFYNFYPYSFALLYLFFFFCYLMSLFRDKKVCRRHFADRLGSEHSKQTHFCE